METNKKHFKNLARDSGNFEEGSFRMLEALYFQGEEMIELLKEIKVGRSK